MKIKFERTIIGLMIGLLLSYQVAIGAGSVFKTNRFNPNVGSTNSNFSFKNIKNNINSKDISQDRKNSAISEISNIINVVNTAIKNSLEIVKSIGTAPLIENNSKQTLYNSLKSLSSNIQNLVPNRVLARLGPGLFTKFSLNDAFDPNKVATFDDIKEKAITNLIIDQKLLNCDAPDDATKDLCNGITNLLTDLSVKKRLTINDVYKLMVYQSTISQAIYYEGTLQQYKKGALILGIDRTTNTINSIDIVRAYSDINPYNNDVLPFYAGKITIYNNNGTVPTFTGDKFAIILGLKDGSVIGLKTYPFDDNLTVPGATMYKIMEVDGYKKCSDIGINTYTDSLSYDQYYNIDIKHDGSKPAHGIAINYFDKCYDIYK